MRRREGRRPLAAPTFKTGRLRAQAPAGAMAEALEREADLHLVVHNAAGAVSVQLGISITEALIRLRAYAFGSDRLLRDVAEDVVARRPRF